MTDCSYKLGDKVAIRGFGRWRLGVIDKLTPKYAWVRYSTPHGGEHVSRTHRGHLWSSLEAAMKHEAERRERERVAFEQRQAERQARREAGTSRAAILVSRFRS